MSRGFLDHHSTPNIITITEEHKPETLSGAGITARPAAVVVGAAESGFKSDRITAISSAA
ncbi:hypothetical protein [Rhodococcus globerulus]|uniref:Uncharacterized protein n=1 Tax=Rhodococcus globerulus TaxID=33008 RepID=A0ABU4C592_RHOGO|nr:hypothetical protein [Rhodococcus globerulus]MDV6271667.1 hypothetical protein [Rhodococcus globerulus]